MGDDLLVRGVPVFIAVIFVILIGAVAVAVVKGLARWSRNNASPVETLPATVTGKRTSVSGGNSTRARSWYHATFELPDRSRVELSVRARVYAQLAEGDRGLLTRQGTRFKGFQREGAPPVSR